MITITGSGKAGGVKVILRGNSPYITTGFLLAMGAQDILAGKAQRAGFVSLSQAFGARHVLKRMEECGTITEVESN